MTDSAKPVETKESLTLWLPLAVLENLNQLVLLRGTKKAIPTKSEVVANLVNEALRKAQLRKP